MLSRPSGPPWALSLALALAAWTVALAALAVADRAAVLAFGRATLAGWAAFDALLAILLFRFARRPRPGALVVATALAAADAAFSIVHAARAGAPHAAWHAALRLVATVGPIAGALALGWASAVRLRLRGEAGW